MFLLFFDYSFLQFASFMFLIFLLLLLLLLYFLMCLLKLDCNDYGVALEERKGIDERHVWSVDFDTSDWRGVLVLVLSLHVYFTPLISSSMRFDLDDFHSFSSSNSFMPF